MCHELPGSLQGLVYIIPHRLAWACIRHSPFLHPPFTPPPPFAFMPPLCHPFFAAPSVQNGFVCFSSNQLLPEKQVHNLRESKIRNQANDKRKPIFLTVPHSKFPPGRHFQLLVRGLFHLLDMHFMFHLLDMHFTPQASSSPGVFHVGSPMPSDKLPPLCEIVAAVQREQAWKQQAGRKRAGKTLRLKGICLNPFHQTPLMKGGKKKTKKDKCSACQNYSQWKSALLRCHVDDFKPLPLPWAKSYKEQIHRHTRHLYPTCRAKEIPAAKKSVYGSSGAV